MQGNLAAVHRTCERKTVVMTFKEPFIDKVMYWLESEEPACQRMASYGFLALAALYFLSGILRAVF
ncbi:hypothetical protein [Desulfotruncus alcoholivorax]|uniref:hypothetical protein n=1 Tax=Desulfotruncus alcoholivorax TaxID=265477 RepID=UPI000482E323|nr:hypothetical protein [Desulfotruncus alcoholivorax]